LNFHNSCDKIISLKIETERACVPTIILKYRQKRNVKVKNTYCNLKRTSIHPYDKNPYGVEWMGYDPDAALLELVKIVPHIAFEVVELTKELKGKEIPIQPNNPSKGATIEFEVDNCGPVDFLQIEKKKI